MFSETNDTESCDRGINQMLMLEIARAKTIQLRFSQTFSSLNEQFHIFNSEFEVRLNTQEKDCKTNPCDRTPDRRPLCGTLFIHLRRRRHSRPSSVTGLSERRSLRWFWSKSPVDEKNSADITCSLCTNVRIFLLPWIDRPGFQGGRSMEEGHRDVTSTWTP